MVTGNTQIKRKRYYTVLNIYPNGSGKRQTKWFATGLNERGNKTKAESITRVLCQLFNRDGTLIEKYAGRSDPVTAISRDFELPEITQQSLRGIFGESTAKADTDLQKAILRVDSAVSDFENPEYIANMPFCDYMVLWLEQLAPSLDRGTYGSYRRLVHGRIYSYFRDIAVTVKDLKPVHIEAFYRFLSTKEGLSQNSILHYHCNIRKALQQLYVKQTIQNNPADLISNRPVREPFVTNFYNEEQIMTYLEIVKGTKMELPVLGASFYGFRRSEILGLKDSAIDFKRRIITVRHTVVPTVIDGKYEILRKDCTKSKQSMRSLPLVDIFETAITEAAERQEHYKRQLGSLYFNADRAYLCRDEMGRLLNPNYISQKHKALLEKNNLPHIRFHDLRHSCATLLLAKKVPLEQIREWLGHADIQMTMRYAHLNVSQAKDEMAAIMNGVLNSER